MGGEREEGELGMRTLPECGQPAELAVRKRLEADWMRVLSDSRVTGCVEGEEQIQRAVPERAPRVQQQP